MASRPEEEFISVVMPVHNALPHLDDAVSSILDQTHRNFEFVIYDDGSTDGSTQRLRDWAKRDARIKLHEGEHKLGPVGSSATVVEKSTGAIVARMDADDISDPRRLEFELEALQASPSAGLVGTVFDVIDDQGRRIRSPDFWKVRRKSAFLPFAHGSVMFRRDPFERVGGYRVGCDYWEDQDLIPRIAGLSEILVLPLALYRVRQWTRPRRPDADETHVENAVDLMYRCLARIEQGRSYDDLLAEHKQGRVDPRVFVSTGSRMLWAGGRPRILGRVLKRAKLRLDLPSASTLIWVAWASVSPGSLRAFLRLLLRIRNNRSRDLLTVTGALRWSPGGAASPALAPELRGAPLDLVRRADSR